MRAMFARTWLRLTARFLPRESDCVRSRVGTVIAAMVSPVWQSI